MAVKLRRHLWPDASDGAASHRASQLHARRCRGNDEEAAAPKRGARRAREAAPPSSITGSQSRAALRASRAVEPEAAAALKQRQARDNRCRRDGVSRAARHHPIRPPLAGRPVPPLHRHACRAATPARRRSRLPRSLHRPSRRARCRLAPGRLHSTPRPPTARQRTAGPARSYPAAPAVPPGSANRHSPSAPARRRCRAARIRRPRRAHAAVRAGPPMPMPAPELPPAAPLAGQPVARPVVPPRPDLAAKLGAAAPGHAGSHAAPRRVPALPGRPVAPVPGQPIYRGPIRPGQPIVTRQGRRSPRPGPGCPLRPGGPRPQHPTSRWPYGTGSCRRRRSNRHAAVPATSAAVRNRASGDRGREDRCGRSAARWTPDRRPSTARSPSPKASPSKSFPKSWMSRPTW